MKKFIINIIFFILATLVVGECTVRVTHAVADIPQRTIDTFGIQKYKPNQSGYWKDGEHKWVINEFGWPGELPTNYDRLIMIIGDSFIENFMNPNECHQSILLKQKMNTFNFMEAGRSGISLIEAMEISKQMDSLKPIHSLVFVNDNDFYESISEVKTMSDITQISINNERIEYGKMKSPGLKKILYNWKLLYYFYNRFPVNNSLNTKPKDSGSNKKNVEEITKTNAFENEVFKLLLYIKNNYNIGDKTLVFHPKSNPLIIKMCQNLGFNLILLDSSKDDKSWTFDYDSHWTCYGHKRVSEQVSEAMLKKLTEVKFNTKRQ